MLKYKQTENTIVNIENDTQTKVLMIVYNLHRYCGWDHNCLPLFNLSLLLLNFSFFWSSVLDEKFCLLNVPIQ
jgi:hypothetical protein